MVKNLPFQKRWARAVAEIGKIKDALGMPVDEGIRQSVIALWFLGFSTDGSCEGHLGRGWAAPWVDVIAPSPPKYKWKGEKAMENAILKQIGAAKTQISPGRGFDSKVWQGFREAQSLWLQEQGHIQSPAFTAFMRRCSGVYLDLCALVEEFNHNLANPRRRICLHFLQASGHTRISVMDEWVLEDNALNQKITSRKLSGRLLARQELMREFTKSLINRAKNT